MRLLHFTAATAAAFSLAYVALMHDEHRLTAAERRTHGKLLDRFDAASVDDGPKGRKLAENGAEIVIEDAEHTLLVRLFADTPWRTSLSREVNSAEDFLKAAPEYTPDSKAPQAAPNTAAARRSRPPLSTVGFRESPAE